MSCLLLSIAIWNFWLLLSLSTKFSQFTSETVITQSQESESWLCFLSLNCSVLYITLDEFSQGFLHIHLSMSVCNCSLSVHDSSNLWGCYCPFFFIPNCVNSSFISLEVMELLLTYINQYYRQRYTVCIVLWIQFFVITYPCKELHMKRRKWRFCAGSEHGNMDEALKTLVFSHE